MAGREANRDTGRSMRTLAEGISIHSFDSGAGLLFDSNQQAIFSANPSALAIWRGLDQRLSPSDVAEFLSEEADLEQATARQYVAQALRQWRDWRRGLEAETAANRQRPRSARDSKTQLPFKTESLRCYRLLDSGFTLRFDARLPAARIVTALRHLRRDLPRSADERNLVVQPWEQGYAITEARQVVYSCTREEEILPMVKAALIDRALADCDGLGALHAAALYKDGGSLLFPGASGSGKSCLSAILAAAGHTLLGDDTLVLSRDASTLRPMPFGICIKDTALELLSASHPRLEELPRHARPDGKQVRYLTPPRIAVADSGRSFPVSAIVFPKIVPDRPSRLDRIALDEALQGIVANFTPLGSRLEAADIDRLIAWVARRPCYRLEISSLDEARQLLEGLGA
ncbi:MAG: PqqD family peptide modification chaperone [Rhodovibrionaceae bacterium]